MRKNNILVVLACFLFLGFLSGCILDENSDAPQAAFEFSPTNQIQTNDTILFKNRSKNANVYRWDFGDGSFSNEREPKHAFQNKRTYTVKLFAMQQYILDNDILLLTDSSTKTVTISICKPLANFNYKRFSNFSVEFKNNSVNGTSFLWNFGDGTTSNEMEPKHSYTRNGTYLVTLIANYEDVSDTICKTLELTDVVDLNNLQIPMSRGREVSIDVDLDGIDDLSFNNYKIPTLATEGKHFIFQLTPHNGFEIITDTILVYCYKKPVLYWEKFEIPKKFEVGDVLDGSCPTQSKAITICEYHYIESEISISNTSWFSFFHTNYMGFRKKVNDNYWIGWIKLQPTSWEQVTLCSFKIPTESDKMKIEE